MTTWILDDGPLDLLSQFIDAINWQNWSQMQLFVAKQTAVDARQSPARYDLLVSYPTLFHTFEIMVDTLAFDIVHGHLRTTASRAAANLAEHQAIAWIISECTDGVFVTCDKKAAFLALAELGRNHVAHPYDLWLHLRDQRLINQTQFDDLCQKTRISDQSVIPWRCQ